MTNIFDTEKKYTASNGTIVTFLEDPYPVQNYFGKKKLMFIFQSLGDETSKDPSKRFPYTMVNGFRFLNCRKIYIKDSYGEMGCYYLGQNGNFTVEEAIFEFIKKKISEYGIQCKDVMFYGNSKGGYAALNFGFMLGRGVNILAGVPQVDLYSWISKYKPFLSYIFPKNMQESDKIIYRDRLIKRVDESLNIGKPSLCTIITSHNDNTYSDHIPALLKSLDENNIKNNVYFVDELYVTRYSNVIINSVDYAYFVICGWIIEGLHGSL